MNYQVGTTIKDGSGKLWVITKRYVWDKWIDLNLINKETGERGDLRVKNIHKEMIDRLYNDCLENQCLTSTMKPYEFPDEVEDIDPKVMDYFSSRLKSNRHSDMADAFMYSVSAWPKLPWYKKLWFKLKRIFK